MTETAPQLARAARHPLTPTHARARVTRVDNAKFLAVAMVVFGHVVGGVNALGIPGDSISSALFFMQMQHGFRMPALFLLAGIFVERSLRKGSRPFLTEKLEYLVYPYLVWNLIAFFSIAVGNIVQDRLGTSMIHSEKIPWIKLVDMLYEPQLNWFLYALFGTYIVYALLRKAGLRIRWILVISAVTHTIARLGLVDASPMAFHVGRLLIYFTVGAAFAHWLLNVGHRARWWQPFLVAIPCLIATSLFASAEVMSAVARVDAHGHSIIDAQNIRLLAEQIPMRLGISLTGTAAVLSLAIMLERLHAPRIFQFMGQISLEIYLVSSFAMIASRVLLFNVLHIHQPWLLILGGVTAGLVVPLVVVLICNRLGVKYLFRFGRTNARWNPTPVPLPKA